jgi:2-oxoglutarate dehydrogenase E2 component (dihydrolipoamide succinyltransferase)
MEFEIKMPSPGESVSEAEIASWRRADGDLVTKDEVILEVETDKASLEICAEYSGRLQIMAKENQVVQVGAVLGKIFSQEGEVPESHNEGKEVTQQQGSGVTESDKVQGQSGPAARRLLSENNLDSSQVEGSAKGGRVTKGDVLTHLENASKSGSPQVVSSASTVTQPTSQDETSTGEHSPFPTVDKGSRQETPVPLTRMRRRIAERLKEVQNTAAILTSFNEVDMSAVMDLRTQYKEAFLKRHGVKLGFMSFFSMACVEALKQFPNVNSEWRGESLIQKNFYDIGVAVSTGKGLVVPVVRGAENLGLAEIEKSIALMAEKAREGRLTVDEMSGGTFTITNGGVFGSMLSTPIINAPQTAILGMHNIQKRAVVIQDEICIRPMMYLALSYDHRVIDGKEAVQFLVAVKNCIEDPSRMLLGV